MNLSSPLNSLLKHAATALKAFRRSPPPPPTCRRGRPTWLRLSSLLPLAALGLIHAADLSPDPRDPVLSGDAFSAGFVRTGETADPPPLNGTNGDILRNIPGYSRQRLWFSRGVIPKQGGPQFGTCPAGIAQFEHVQDIQPIGDWSKGSGYIFVSHSQHKFGHLFVLKTSQVAPPPNEHELFGFHGLNGAAPDGAGIWHHRLDFNAPEQWYNHPGDLAAVGNILLVTAENWKGESVCELERVGDPATSRPPEDAILFYDVVNPELPVYLGKIPVSKLPVPLERIDSLNAARIGAKYFLMVGSRWFESDTMVPDPATWRISNRTVLGAVPGFGGTVTVHSSDTGLEETWLLAMDSSQYHARQVIVTDSQLIFPPTSRKYDVDEGVVAPIVVDGPIGRTLQVLNGVHVTRRGRMAYLSCAAGFGVRRVELLGVPIIGEIDEDILEVDVHAIHYAGDVEWPAGFSVLPTLTALSDAFGWGGERFYSTIQTGDVDGDGRADVLARSAFGLVAWSLRGHEWIPLPGSIPFSDPAWAPDEYNSTIQVADLDGDGKVEVLARSALGVGAWKHDGTDWRSLPGIVPLSDATGWNLPRYYSSIQTADVDGDGRAELLARTSLGMAAWKHTGSAWLQLPGVIPFTDATGWSNPQYYSTIQTADVDGDGAAEVLGRAAVGLVAFKFNGTAWVPLPGLIPFTDAMSWDKKQYYATIQSADIDNDGRAEILGRGRDGLAAWEFDGTGWKLKTSILLPFTDAAGWDEPRHYSTIMVADLDGTGNNEVLARSAHGVGVIRYQAPGWDLTPSRLNYADHLGWDDPRYYTTIQTADVDGDGIDEVLARSADGLLVRKLAASRHRLMNPNRRPIAIDTTRPLPSVIWDDFADGARLEQADHLKGGLWIPAEGAFTRENGRLSLPLPAGIPQRFYRLQ